ncbi:hypothetical protein [Ruegeria sp. HKCCA4707]|uniref:hypothetical protein n=1 Tax=Ruegeria sp. HKCCA4707 TaxID=2682984 RepID=UPI001487C99F|nr:hypothetical protein [Ruegeria sp. HKCCA4707]
MSVDYDTIKVALHSVASQAILDATLAAQNKVPLNDADIQLRIDTAMGLIISETIQIEPPPN